MEPQTDPEFLAALSNVLIELRVSLLRLDDVVREINVISGRLDRTTEQAKREASRAR